MKVLVVEDNYYTRDIIIRRLTRAGHQVITSTDGAQCLELACAEKPHIILLDVRLPTRSGFEIARQLRASSETRDIPIIAITAYALEESREQARSAGCDDFEAKPLDFVQLLAKMSALTAKGRT
jgi:two-component system cell cycle response regulator DivK